MFKSIVIAIFLSVLSYTSIAQQKKVVTDTLTVSGVCGMCENRIENAVSIKGVKKAEWDKSTQLLTITYLPNKTSLEKINNAIISAGHDTRLGVASSNNYNQLDDCCRYRELDIH